MLVKKIFYGDEEALTPEVDWLRNALGWTYLNGNDNLVRVYAYADLYDDSGSAGYKFETINDAYTDVKALFIGDFLVKWRQTSLTYSINANRTKITCTVVYSCSLP